MIAELNRRRGLRCPSGPGGYTLAELVMVCALLATLGALVLPVAKFSVRRGKEVQLRQSLREMRNAIDEYKRFVDAGLIELELGAEGYPTELEQLIEPIDLVGQVDKQVRFLRRIPRDPMTGEYEWGRRSVQDEWDSDSWGGENVYDVYSKSEGVGMNGVPYTLW
jgi:general secretion pathway protein G